MRGHHLVDPSRVAVVGGSQGGGISTSVAALARLALAPALWSVAMRDVTCPPSTVFAAYHSYGGPKEIGVYEFNDHEGGDAFHRSRQLTWLASNV